MALTLLSRMIVTILGNDPAMTRAGFRDMVNEHTLGRLQHPTDYMVAIKLCRSLADDAAVMPAALCELTAMPPGSTFARGADAWVAAVLRPCSPAPSQAAIVIGKHPGRDSADRGSRGDNPGRPPASNFADRLSRSGAWPGRH